MENVLRNFIARDFLSSIPIKPDKSDGQLYNGRDFLSPSKKNSVLPMRMLLRQPIKPPEIYASSQLAANKELCKGGHYLSSS